MSYGGYYGSGYGEGLSISVADPSIPLLGRDIAFVNGDYMVTKDGDWATVEGVAAVRQWVIHCLLTRPGEFRARPDFGCGVLDWVKEPKTEANLASLATRIRTQLLRSSRIEDASVTVSDLEGAAIPGLSVAVSVLARGRKLDLGAFTFAEP